MLKGLEVHGEEAGLQPNFPAFPHLGGSQRIQSTPGTWGWWWGWNRAVGDLGQLKGISNLKIQSEGYAAPGFVCVPIACGSQARVSELFFPTPPAGQIGLRLALEANPGLPGLGAGPLPFSGMVGHLGYTSSLL